MNNLVRVLVIRSPDYPYAMIIIENRDEESRLVKNEEFPLQVTSRQVSRYII